MKWELKMYLVVIYSLSKLNIIETEEEMRKYCIECLQFYDRGLFIPMYGEEGFSQDYDSLSTDDLIDMFCTKFNLFYEGKETATVIKGDNVRLFLGEN